MSISGRVKARHGLVVAGIAVTALAVLIPMAWASPAPAAAAPGTITTVAGGTGGPARATTVAVGPTGLTWHDASIYLADGVVQKVSAKDYLTTPVGDLAQGAVLSAGHPARRANLDAQDVAFAPDGNMIISLFYRHEVLIDPATAGTYFGRPMRAGYLYRLAGTGKAGFAGDGGPATAARLVGPLGVSVDAHGNVLIADTNRIRVVAASTGTFYGIAMTAGDIYTVAGSGSSGSAGDGGPATKAWLGETDKVITDGAGNLVLADTNENKIRVVAASTGSFYGQPMTAGDIYTVAGHDSNQVGFSGDGGPAVKARLAEPESVAVDHAGNLVIADSLNNRVRVVAVRTGTFYGVAMTAGDIYTVAGNGKDGITGLGGPAAKAAIDAVGAVAVDGAGNLLASDLGRVLAVAAGTGTFYGQPMKAGHIYSVAGTGQAVGNSGDGGPATSAELEPSGVAADSAGNVLIDDYQNDLVQAVAAKTGELFGEQVTAGHIYAVAGGGTLPKFHNGAPARADHLIPTGVAADAAGNLVISTEDQIRVVAAKSGTFYGMTMKADHMYRIAGGGKKGHYGDGGPATAAHLIYPGPVAVDPSGNLVVPDTGHHRIRVIAERTGTFFGQAMTAGDIYTVAGTGRLGFRGDGGPATKAELNVWGQVSVDAAGNLLIADTDNNRIRVVAATSGTFYGQHMTVGDIYTVVGDGTSGFSGDGGPATAAELNEPEGVVADSAGNLLIADTNNNRIRVVAARTGTFYGVPMTARDIYTIAGMGGNPGFSGNGVPGTKARLARPGQLAMDGASVLVADTGTDRIRAIAG